MNTATMTEASVEGAAVRARSPLLPRIRLQWLIIGACLLAVVYLAVMPLGFLVWQSFLTPETASTAGRFTLENYATAYGSPETLGLLKNSVLYAAGTAIFSFLVGATLAWMNERTNTPFKSAFFALAMIPLVMPGIMFTISWILIASPKIGIVNMLLQQWLGTDYVFVNIYSIGGMVWVEGLHYSPMAFLIMSAAFRSMDPSLEESALMSGASIWQILWRITIKLTWPAIFAALLILFVRAIESFEAPALLGLPVGIHVFTSAIYQAVHQYPSKVGLASAYGTALLLITTAGIWLQSRLTGKGSRYATITGKGFRPRVIDLGRWRWLTGALFIAYFVCVVLLPLLVLVWSSLQKFYSVPSLASLQNLGFDAYRFVLNHPNIGSSVWNSVLLAFASATLIMLLTSVICWVVIKTRMPGRWLLDNVASLPLVFPGLVLGLAVMAFYLNADIGVYGTMWILLIAYVTRFLPYGMRYNSTSMLQIHKELEESAQMSGASWLTMFRRIILPLLKPGLIGGWIYIFIVSIRELSASILLYSPGTEVVSIVIWEFWESGQFVELSALGVMFIVVLLALVMLAQYASRRFGVKEA
ncbi:MAG TPA: iron ABC transporter permease [Ramlibacter sp.]|nr:iron ABC transporter permease [Ramlibacter sp.]